LSGYHEYGKTYTKIVKEHFPFHSSQIYRQFSMQKKLLNIFQIMQRKIISTKELMLILVSGIKNYDYR